MELQEALDKIKELEGKLDGVSDKQATAVKEATDKLGKEHKTALQVQYNKGFDASTNKHKDDKEGFISKEDVDKMLSDRDTSFSRQSALKSLGIKNPKNAMKIISDDDLATLGSKDFKEEDFKKKYGDDIVFTSQKEEAKKPSNFTKNNTKVKTDMTAASYAEMSTSERAKISTADKLALLG